MGRFSYNILRFRRRPECLPLLNDTIIFRETARLLANRLHLALDQAQDRAEKIAPKACMFHESELAMCLDDFTALRLRPIVTRATLGATLGIQRRD